MKFYSNGMRYFPIKKQNLSRAVVLLESCASFRFQFGEASERAGRDPQVFDFRLAGKQSRPQQRRDYQLEVPIASLSISPFYTDILINLKNVCKLFEESFQ
jgi:hypothetical protein